MNRPYVGNLVQDAERERTQGRVTHVTPGGQAHVTWPDGWQSIYGKDAARQWLRPVGAAKEFNAFGDLFEK